MLDPRPRTSARDKLADDVRKQIEKDGELEQADTWGMRKMAYEIRQRNEADYRYYRFQAENELLERLNHNLKIADGALRFRIFKVDPETPSNPPPASPERGAPVGEARGERGERARPPRPRRRLAAGTRPLAVGSAGRSLRRYLPRGGEKRPGRDLRSQFGIERRGADQFGGDNINVGRDHREPDQGP